MPPSRAIEILERQRQIIGTLRQTDRRSPDLTKWRRDTDIAIERIFGADSRNINDFRGIRYTLSVFTDRTPDSEFHQAYLSGLSHAEAILKSMIDEIRDYGENQTHQPLAPDDLNLLERICLKFHAAARTLQVRYNNRPTIEINDEYDVQNLLHTFLRLHFDDIRPEEWTPSYAGSASRVDFLLKKERTVIEVKKTRPTLKTKELGEQLIIDRARYEKHPDCDLLVCFIYDPENRIGNPVGIERDLEDHTGRLKVRVIIAPK